MRRLRESPQARIAIGVASLLVNAIFFLFVDLGGTITGALHPGAALYIVLWTFPLFVFLKLVRDLRFAVLGGLGLLSITALFLIDLFQDEHSTAGIGAGLVPFMVLLPAAVILLAIERFLARLRHSRGR